MQGIVSELTEILSAFPSAAREGVRAATNGCDICLTQCADNCGGSGDWI